MFRCLICEKVFTSKILRNNHIADKHFQENEMVIQPGQGDWDESPHILTSLIQSPSGMGPPLSLSDYQKALKKVNFVDSPAAINVCDCSCAGCSICCNEFKIPEVPHQRKNIKRKADDCEASTSKMQVIESDYWFCGDAQDDNAQDMMFSGEDDSWL